jgi:hypothetical protein
MPFLLEMCIVKKVEKYCLPFRRAKAGLFLTLPLLFYRQVPLDPAL